MKGILKKNGECTTWLKYSVSIYVEEIVKIQRMGVSCALRLIYTSLCAKALMDAPDENVE